MANVKISLFVALLTLFYRETKGFCEVDYNCPGLQVCCNKGDVFKSKCRDNCFSSVGEFCYLDSNCINSYCCNNYCRASCIGQSCTVDSECGPGNYCCNYECRGSCKGHSCYIDSNCGDQKYCCNSKCRNSCIGQPCHYNSNCGDYSEYCCNGKCRKEKCDLSQTWVIIIVIFSFLTVVGIIVGAVLVYNRAYFNRRLPGVVTSAPLVTTTIATNSTVSYAHFRSDCEPPL